MLLLQIIRCVHTRNLDNACAVSATLQKLRVCYLLRRCSRRAVNVFPQA